MRDDRKVLDCLGHFVINVLASHFAAWVIMGPKNHGEPSILENIVIVKLK